MALTEEMGQQGRWLFRRHSYLPIALAIAVRFATAQILQVAKNRLLNSAR